MPTISTFTLFVASKFANRLGSVNGETGPAAMSPAGYQSVIVRRGCAETTDAVTASAATRNHTTGRHFMVNTTPPRPCLVVSPISWPPDPLLAMLPLAPAPGPEGCLASAPKI